MNPNEKSAPVKRTVWPGNKTALRRVVLIGAFLFALSWVIFALLVGDWGLNFTDNTEESNRHLREWLFILAGSTGLVFLASLLAPFQRLTRACQWFLTGRRLRWNLIVLAWLVTLAGLFYAEEDWRGSHTWTKYQRQIVANGVNLDFASYLPKAVPDDQNFAAIPAVKSWFPQYPGFTNDHFAMVSVKMDVPEALRHRQHYIDLAAWGTVFDKLRAGQTNLPETEESGIVDHQARIAGAQSVLAGLGDDGPVLAELSTASQRPFAVYPVTYDLENLWGTRLPHLWSVKQAVLRLNLRASAELATGRTDDAFADTKLMLYLAGTLKDEPFIISHLVRVAVVQIAVRPVWEGLAQHAWSDAQLRGLQEQFQAYNFVADLQRPLDVERAANILTTAQIKKKGLGLLIAIIGPGQPGSGDLKLANWAGAMVPSGWYDLELYNLCRLYDLQMDGTMSPEQKQIFPDRVDSSVTRAGEMLQARSFASAFLRHQALARTVMWSFGKIMQRIAAGQTTVNQAAIACALERYRLANGHFPVSLDALAPAIMPEIPQDALTGKPYDYHLGDDGVFELSCAGWTPKDVPTPGPDYLGNYKPDWVWNSGPQ